MISITNEEAIEILILHDDLVWKRDHHITPALEREARDLAIKALQTPLKVWVVAEQSWNGYAFVFDSAYTFKTEEEAKAFVARRKANAVKKDDIYFDIEECEL